MRVSFTGKVFLTGVTSKKTNNSEIRTLKKYAKRNQCDVIVLDNNSYINGKGIYTTLVVKENPTTNKNSLWAKIFNFRQKYPRI